MRQTISGLVAAIAVVTASAAPAMACGLFDSGCGAPCSPCGQSYAPRAPVYSGCDSGCGPAGYERLPDPEQQYYSAPAVHQYYYTNQGPTYTGPGDFAPYPTYQESAVSGWNTYRHHAYHYGYDGGRYADATNHYYDGAPNVEGPAIYRYHAHPHFRPWHAHYGTHYAVHPSLRYGYGYHHGYATHYSLPPRGYYAPHRSMRYGYHTGMPHQYGYREHTLRRYY
jgi:hypothetical protein